ncbi:MULTISPECIES: septum site-determining protein MinC [Bacillaceae]|uniref:Probable septum site-determining protein MinC n=1 Tax=Evansella alkalicola TaxID=745819 RepID=A0ABS6JTI8_9BACI|nr:MULTISPECIES: septum site-determining protein MinC [Bacillaceae]MBU9721901.1 septum site-determining protein MinC [Bacillus alkalicola]
MVQKTVKKQNVLIKGTKSGLTFILNDQCSFDSLLSELQEKLSERPRSVSNDSDFVRVKLVTGKRYLERNQIESLEKTLSDYIHAVIDHIDSDVLTKKEAEELRKNQEVNRLLKVVRSGQVVEVVGDLLLLGDVNPGGTVKATGNIYVMGKLQGIAHAGSDGDMNAVICASLMFPSQLRIGDVIRRPPEMDDNVPQEMECAFVNDKGDMEVDSIQKLVQYRPDVSSILEN